MTEKKKKILIVDDDNDMLVLIRHFLRDADYEIVMTRRGDEALQMVIDEVPDIALIDGLIPGIHGFELCEQIKENKDIIRKPKIIIMSSVYKAQKYKFEVTEYKADDFLAKPFSKDQLLAKISSLA
jgi:DNA-binding response OmpR family regulator